MKLSLENKLYCCYVCEIAAPIIHDKLGNLREFTELKTAIAVDGLLAAGLLLLFNAKFVMASLLLRFPCLSLGG